MFARVWPEMWCRNQYNYAPTAVSQPRRPNSAKFRRITVKYCSLPFPSPSLFFLREIERNFRSIAAAVRFAIASKGAKGFYLRHKSQSKSEEKEYFALFGFFGFLRERPRGQLGNPSHIRDRTHLDKYLILPYYCTTQNQKNSKQDYDSHSGFCTLFLKKLVNVLPRILVPRKRF